MTFKVSGYYVLQLKQLYPLRGGGWGDGGTGIVKSLKEEKAVFSDVNNSC